MAGLAIMAASLLASAAAQAAPARDQRPPRGRIDAPVAVVAPTSGAPILVWSQFDGSARKVAWSRLDGGRWREPKFLTFGPGDDLAPAVGLSRAGSRLFWIDGRGRVVHAPFDPETGRLFALPRDLPAPGAPRPGARPEGGTDAPVILGNCAKLKNEPCIGSGSGAPLPVNPPPPMPVAPEGGTDAPIVLTTGTTIVTTITVASSPVCGTQVLSVASDGMVTVTSINAIGQETVLAHYVLAPDIDPADATAVAGTYFLRITCR